MRNPKQRGGIWPPLFILTKGIYSVTFHRKVGTEGNGWFKNPPLPPFGKGGMVGFSVIPAFAENGFTQKDRELLTELKVKM
jgi:hypothetical protein